MQFEASAGKTPISKTPISETPISEAPISEAPISEEKSILVSLGVHTMIEHLEGTHETVNYRKNTNLRIYDNHQYEEYPMHWHSPIEIVMPVHQDYRVEYADSAYILHEGDILIICPGVLHHFYACEGQRYIIQAEISSVLNLREIDSILTIIQPALLITPKLFPEVYSQIRDLVVRIEREYLKGESFFEASIYSMIAEIFVLIGRSRAQAAQRFAADDVRQKKYVEKFMDVCSYIDEHCTENLTLDDIASYSGFSKYHFTRLFKQFTGSTFYKYLNQKRITRAERSLSDMTLSVTDVAMASGFTSMSAFIRMFKIMKGCTPSEFRRMYSPNLGQLSSGGSSPVL